MSLKVSNLALDVWSDIVLLLDAFDLANCWMTGYPQMQTIISMVCEDFRLIIVPQQGDKQRISRVAFPDKFVSRLPRLKQVVLRPGFLRVLERGSWDAFPRSITKLNLVALECWTLFYDCDISPDAAHSINLSSSTPVIKVGALFPNLKELTISGRHIAQSHPDVDFSIIAHLPHVLETFAVCASIPLGVACVAAFPRSITNLSFTGRPLEQNYGEALHSLPLTSLFMNISSFDMHDVKLLPLSLTLLNLRSTTLEMSCIQYLPPNLKSLILTIRNEMDASFSLPQFPTSLTCLECWHTFPLKDEDIESLPPKLTSLKLVTMTNVSRAGLQKLPKTLTSFMVHSAPLINNACIASFPRNMQILSFGNNPSLSASCFPLLPPTLTSLGLRMSTDISDKDIKFLPRSLTRFTCNSPFLSSLSIPDFPSQLIDVDHSFKILDLETGTIKPFHEFQPLTNGSGR